MSQVIARTPSNKEVMQVVMVYVGTDTAVTQGPDGPVEKTYVSYRCPKANCPKGIVRFRDKTVFENPFSHLRSCYAKGLPEPEQEEKVLKLYEEAREKSTTQGGTIRSHFATHTPLCILENGAMRKISRHNVNVCSRTITRTILRLVGLVEKAIAREMHYTKGALLFDGWSCGGIHSVACIASYCARVSGSTTVAPRLAVMSVSPMGFLADESTDDEEVPDETSQFDAETHLNHFKNVFDFYDISFEWVTCYVFDNASVNRKLARISRKPAVGRNSHKLNLQVNAMIKDDVELSNVIDSVQRKMLSARKFKNAALLRNLTDYKPIINNDTRWYGTRRMLD